MKNPCVLMATLVYGSVEKSREGRALHIANPLTLPFYLLPFYLLRVDGGPGRGRLTLQLLGESIAHCKSLDFTFLPFTFLPFEGGLKIQKCLPGSMAQEAVW